MNKVYVVQEVMKRDGAGVFQPAYNLAPASRFGILTPVLDSQRIPLATEALMHRLRTCLSAYRDGDYLLPVGDPVAIAAATMVAAHFNEGRVTLLRYEKKSDEYIPITLELFPKHVSREFRGRL